MIERTNDPSHLTLFGGFSLTASTGEPVAVSSRKAQVLISYLAHRSGQPIPRTKLAAMFWSETSESEARHSLRQCLLVLRQTLAAAPGLLDIGPEAVRLRRDRVATDALEFEGLIAKGTEESLGRAIDLYRGEFLEGIHLAGEPIDEWIVFERRRLAHLMKRALLGLLESSRSAGRIDDAIHAATRLLAIDPQQEEVRSTLVQLYGNSGRATRSAIVATTDAAARRLAVDVLAGAGYETRTCTDGADLLLGIGAVEPHLVLLDTTLPLFDVADLVRSLAAKLPHIPLICLGDPDEETESAMLSLGAADFVPKPLDSEVLLLRVDHAVDPQGRRSQRGA